MKATGPHRSGAAQSARSFVSQRSYHSRRGRRSSFLVAMLSLGVGLQELASKRLSQSGLFDTILVTPKNNFRGAGRPQREEQPGKPVRVLDEDARKEIEKLSECNRSLSADPFLHGSAIQQQTLRDRGLWYAGIVEKFRLIRWHEGPVFFIACRRTKRFCKLNLQKSFPKRPIR